MQLTLTTEIEISDQFFGWVCGFGKKVAILSPDSVIEKFKAHLDKMRELEGEQLKVDLQNRIQTIQ